METKYVIKLKGIDCYLKSTNGKSDFTFDLMKAKVFTVSEKPDLIAKLIAGEYKVNKNSSKTDRIRLTMDQRTWQEMYVDNFDQFQDLSDSRRNIHQFPLSLSKKLEVKAKSYEKCSDFPNFECDYYGEDFERKTLTK